MHKNKINKKKKKVNKIKTIKEVIIYKKIITSNKRNQLFKMVFTY